MERYLEPQGVNTHTQDFSFVRQEGYRLKPISYIGEALGTFGQAVMSYIGYLIVLFAIAFSLGVVSSVIPSIGAVLNFGFQLLYVVFYAGFFAYAHGQFENEKGSFPHFFSGFQHIGQLLLFQLFQFLAFFAVGLLMFVLGSFAGLEGGTRFYDNVTDFLMNGGGFILLVFLLVFYFVISWSLTPMLILFNGMGAGKAMETSRKLVAKNFLSFVWLFVLLFLFNVAGALFLLVGLLATFPASFIILYLAYRDICYQNDPDYAEGDSEMKFGAHDPDKPLDYEF